MAGSTWQSIRVRKQAERQILDPAEWLQAFDLLPSNSDQSALNVMDIPRTCGMLTLKDLEITEKYDATALAAEIRVGRLKCLEVTEAFCKRAAIAQKLTNCLTEMMFGDALGRARWLDEQYAAKGGETVGPLHGVPVSLKDTFKVKGYDASIGIASLAFNPATENSLLVDILLEAGAVIYVKTNVPQTLMALDSDNNLFGRTTNPLNRRVTAGGSSGGEGALIALRGSILGIGTDVGGSIRIPAMCNGLYGLKPSAGRVPFAGQQSTQLPGAEKLALPASAGPICTSLRDCELLMRVVSGARPWERDPDVRMGRWEDMDDLEIGVGERQRRPVIGVVWRDGLSEPLPPVLKVLEEV
ncbi:MAG: hypothetical protein M1830_000668, partial [Pleopsidium flavum]